MTKKHIDVVSEVLTKILLYVDSQLDEDVQYGASIASLEQEEAISDFSFELRPLSEAKLPGLIFVLCQGFDHATALTKQYGLQDNLVYWLSNDSQSANAQKSLQDHFFLDWQNPQALLPVLALFHLHQNALVEQNRAENKLNLLSECLGELSLTLSPDGTIAELNPEFKTLMGGAADTFIGQDLLVCLPIPSISAKKRMQGILSGVNQTHSMTRLPPFPVQLENAVLMLDGFVGPLQDDESLLILRQVASWQSHEWAERLSEQTAPVTLLLINPDDFAQFNQDYGREMGDQVLREVMQSMTNLLRTADFASRYSGAVFAAHLPETNEQEGQVLASRMRKMLREKVFSDRKVALEFSFGIATLESEEQLGEQSPLELFRRANAALQAARSIGGGTLVSWQPKFDANILANLDRMSGKFSQEPDEDFSLITLQWDIIRLIGNTHSLENFSEQLCELLSSGMQCEVAALYLTHGNTLSNLSFKTSATQVDVKNVHRWASENISIDKLLASEIGVFDLSSSSCQALIPLVSRDECLAVILLRWSVEAQDAANKFSEQLQQVTPNLAAAIDRIMLIEQDRKRRLVKDKDQSEGHELLFESGAMRTLMQQVQMVAPTDASVLIIGESGTGKEVIARQIHDHSLLHEKPFITVDCSTIVEHLIESELFGHRKGAFTGATSEQPGMIAQADGGTLFLDEVGELPLDIQSKLLRFVQEKTYVAVGDQRVRKVDVRLVLATNRNLSEEVAAGRFRADLYYRINVFTLNLPPLHQRGNDALLLCRHFLAKFSKQYHKQISDFSPSAIEKLQHYTWPGNVRELRNCMMRAVIMCVGQQLEEQHLVLQEQGQATSLDEQVRAKQNALVTSPPSEKTINLDIASRDHLSVFSAFMNKVVELAQQQSAVFPVSLWLEQQWLNLCLSKWESLYQVALQLGQSESTLRRRHAKLSGMEFKQTQLTELASECHELLAQILTEESGSRAWPKIEATMHSIVMKQNLTQIQKAQLLDVTQPTLRKIMQQVHI